MKKKKAVKRGIILETDLYKPIYEHLIMQGYTVRSEVMNCDMVAVKDDELIAIELKRSFNATLLMQATKRQLAADSTYVAIPKPRGGPFHKDWDGMCRILRRLELGLITVDFVSEDPWVQVVFHPGTFNGIKRAGRARHAILREVAGRNGDYNTGGSSGKKLMTAYRENAVHIACCMMKHGPLSPKQLRDMGTGGKTQSILGKNFYGWFVKAAPGLYHLHAAGYEYLKTCPDLVDRYMKMADGIEGHGRMHE